MSILVFAFGAALLIYSAEHLIGHLVGIASGLKISLFLLAVVFTGIEFDDVFLGVALNLEDLDDVALGIVFGTAISMIGVVLALAAILTPTAVRIPRDYVVIFGCTPLVMVVVALAAPLNPVDGVVLLALFVAFVGYVAVRESRGGTPVFRDAEMYEAHVAVRAGGGTPHRPDAGGRVGRAGDGDGTGERTGDAAGSAFSEAVSEAVPFAAARRRSGWAGLGLAVLALAGLVAGAAITGIGTDGILADYGLQGTVFGATIATVVLTIEDIFLTVEPARKGAPEIGIGNVIGSVVFSVTGKLGVILLAGGLVVGPNVFSWHLPALAALTGAAAYFLSTGRLRRWHGFVLLGMYVVYWVVSLTAFGGVPLDS